MKRKIFPMFAVILLIFGILWLMHELGILELDVPWAPIIVIAIALAMLMRRNLYTANLR